MFPGQSTMNQLDLIIEVTGRPTSEDIESIQSPFAATMLESLPPSKPRQLADMFPDASEDALDLMRKLLMFNPAKRLSAEEALAHPYVAQFHNEEEEPSFDGVIKIPVDDNTKFTVEDYRVRLYSEVVRRRKEQKKQKSRKAKSRQDD